MTGWAEWRNWEWSGDRARLEKVYPSLLAFHRWMRENGTWKDGAYFCNGLGCGMDNIVRFDDEGSGLYKDLDREGRRIACSHIGAFWALSTRRR